MHLGARTHEVERPVGARTQSIRRRSDPQRYDLSRVKPSHAEPADGEECIEQEEEKSSNDAWTFATDFGHNGQTK